LIWFLLINTLVLPYLVDKTISLSTRSPTSQKSASGQTAAEKAAANAKVVILTHEYYTFEAKAAAEAKEKAEAGTKATSEKTTAEAKVVIIAIARHLLFEFSKSTLCFREMQGPSFLGLRQNCRTKTFALQGSLGSDKSLRLLTPELRI
jgi:hypothetical protein